jgi:hypothetical protein
MAFYIRGDYQFCETVCQVSWTRHMYKSAQAELAWYESTAIQILYKSRSDVSLIALMSIDNPHFCGTE